MACGPPGTLTSLSRRTYGLLPRAGMEHVQSRAACLALPTGYPFRRWPTESAQAFRPRFLARAPPRRTRTRRHYLPLAPGLAGSVI